MHLPSLLAAVLCLAPLAAQGFTPQQRAELRAIVRSELRAALRELRPARPAATARRPVLVVVVRRAERDPVRAIFAEENLPAEWLEFTQRNAEYFR